MNEQAVVAAETPQIDIAQLVTDINALFEQADRESLADRTMWRKCWAAYDGDYSDLFASKKPEQARYVLSKFPRAVDYLTRRLSRPVVSNPADTLELKGTTPDGELLAPIFKKLVLDNHERNQFGHVWKRASKCALLSSMAVLKLTPDMSVWPGACRIEDEDAMCVLLDPSGRGRYLMVVKALDYDEVEALALANPEKWDMDQLRQCKGAGGNADARLSRFRDRARSIIGGESTDRLRDTVYLCEYWGPVWQHGSVAMPFARVIIANGTHCVMPPDPEPYGDDQSGFIANPLVERPWKPYGKAYMGDSKDAAESLIRLFNMLLDQFSRRQNVMEMDDSNATPQAIRMVTRHGGSLPPTAVLRKKGPGPLLQSVELGGVAPEGMAMFGLLGQEFEQSTQVTDLARGTTPTLGGRKITATEFSGKASNADETLVGLAEDMEQSTLEPTIQREVDYIARYGDPRDAQIRKIAGDEIAAALEVIAKNPEIQQLAQVAAEAGAAEVDILEIATARLTEIWRQAPLTVRAASISGTLEREQQARRLMDSVSVIMKLPNGALLLDVPKVARRIVELAGLHPDDVLLDESEQMWLQEAAAMMAKEMTTNALAGAEEAGAEEGEGE